MRPLALKWRVSLLVCATSMAGLAFVALTAYVEMKQSLTAGMDRTLEAMAGSVTALLGDPRAAADLALDVEGVVGDPSRRQGPGYRVWFDGAAGDLLTSPQHAELISDATLLKEPPPAPRESAFFDVGGGGIRYRAVWTRPLVAGRTANVVVAITRHPATDALEDFQGRLAYAGGAIGLLTIAATMLLVSVGLRPIGRTARALGAVTHRNVADARIEAADAPQELQPFVGALREMLARLARALEEQKRFVSDASHELRTPLSVARSTIEAARVKDRTPAEYRKALDEVREDLERMGAMVEELLVMARLDEAAAAPAADVFSLPELVEELADTYEATAAGQGGRLELELEPGLVRGDRAQVRRLLSNLMDNAFRHGPAGGTVRVSVRAAVDGMAEVRVHDEGGRIPPEALPQLFDRFYRADESRARATGGVGLGLSIAREAARRHGGEITVTSTPEDGTTFRVRLPAFTLPSRPVQ
jgi:heavy metal sensor kinase